MTPQVASAAREKGGTAAILGAGRVHHVGSKPTSGFAKATLLPHARDRSDKLGAQVLEPRRSVASVRVSTGGTHISSSSCDIEPSWDSMSCAMNELEGRPGPDCGESVGGGRMLQAGCCDLRLLCSNRRAATAASSAARHEASIMPSST